MKCSLCGKVFKKNQAACSACPMHKGCNMIRCPNCGFEFVEESQIVNFFKNIFKRRKS